MSNDIREYVRGCKICQQDKSLTQEPGGKLKPISVPEGAWDHVTADRIVSLPKTKQGHTAILVVVDKLTKMTHFAPCKNESTAKDIAKLFVDKVWKLHGLPLRLTTDRGPEFANRFIAAVCELVGTMHSKSTAYHPQTDGQTERMNKVLEDFIRHYISPQQNDWDELLPLAEFAINNAYQESTGNTPFFLNFGRHPRIPTDANLAKKPSKDPAATNYIGDVEKALAKAKKCLEAAQQRQRKYADQHRTERRFQVGDVVWLNSRNITLKSGGVRKFLPLWLGPYAVLAKISDVNYTLELPDHFRLSTYTFLVSMLRPAHDNGAGVSRPPMVLVDGDEEFELQTILQHTPAKTKGAPNMKYLISWKGYGPEYNSWEPEKTLKQHAQDALNEYWDEVAAVQAAQSETTDTGLAPSTRTTRSAPGKSHTTGRAGRGRGRGCSKPSLSHSN